jgi:hypothetical protein
VKLGRLPAARLWLPRALAAVVFVAYAWLAAPGVYWLDASELSAASAQLGAPHETGFPLYCLVGKLVALVPIGEIAFRYHLLSALAGAIAVLALCRLIDRLGPGDEAGLGGALVGGVVAAVALAFARQATVAEVYLPNAAVMAIALVWFARVAGGGGPSDGLGLALIAGLGLGLHTTFRVLLALPIVVLLAVRLYRGARWPLYAPLVALAIGAALHLYFPIRSIAPDTARTDWGHPRTAAALVDYVAASGARVGLEDRIMSDEPIVVAHDAGRFARAIGDQLGVLALVAAAGGLAWLARARRGRLIAFALGVILVGDAAFSIWVHPIGIADLQNGLPTTIALAALAGVGVAALARTLGRGAPFAALVLGFLVVVEPAMGSLPEVASSRASEIPRDLADAALASVPPGGVAFLRSDSFVASALLLQVVEGARPDVVVLARQRIGDWPTTEAALRDAGVTRAIARGRPFAWLLELGRPVAWELEDDRPPPGLEPRLGFPLSGLGPAGAAPTAGDLAASVGALTRAFAAEGGDESTARQLFAHGLTTFGRVAFGRGQLPTAAALFDRALAARPDHVEAMINRGVVDSATGDLAAAAAVTERALALEPNRVPALINAARYRLAGGDAARAELHALRAIRLAPQRATAWTLAGLAAEARGAPAVARERLERALSIDPQQRDASAGLARLPR